MDHQIFFSLQKVNQAVSVAGLHQRGFSGQNRILSAPQEISFDRVDQDSVAEIQRYSSLSTLLCSSLLRREISWSSQRWSISWIPSGQK
jgi:hypothetical protein